MLSTPIIYLVFNRPDLTAVTFEAIRKQQPKTLLIVADGPRNAEEAVKCAAVRDIVANVDWECHVLRNYSDVNLGAGRRISSGITWAFEHVNEAIILEDDCLPSDGFFPYCENLLEFWRDDERVMHISGDCFLPTEMKPAESYYFSRYVHCWGWATWKRAWQYFDFRMESWPRFDEDGRLNSVLVESQQSKYWRTVFQRTYENKIREIDAWDYQWVYACWCNNGLAIMPSVNLVTNLGFRADATHTKDASNIPALYTGELTLPMSHPSFVLPDSRKDKYTFHRMFQALPQKLSYRQRLKRRLTRFTYWLRSGWLHTQHDSL